MAGEPKNETPFVRGNTTIESKKFKPKPKPHAQLPPVYVRNVSEDGLEAIARWEGVELVPYDDGGRGKGNATIGVGHLIHMGVVRPADLAKYKGFTYEQAIALLKIDAAKAVAAVNALGLHLVQHEFDALVSFAFNLGAGALAGGISRELHAGNKTAAMAVLQEYNHVGSVVWPGLTRRRAGEANLFLHGAY